MGDIQKRKMSPFVIVVLVLVSLAAVVIIAVGGIFLFGVFGQAKTDSDAKSKENDFIVAVAQATPLKDPTMVLKAANLICSAVSDPNYGKYPGASSPFILAYTNLYMDAKGLTLDDAKTIATLSVKTWCPQFESAITAK
jgi:hypothetical protein